MNTATRETTIFQKCATSRRQMNPLVEDLQLKTEIKDSEALPENHLQIIIEILPGAVQEGPEIHGILRKGALEALHRMQEIDKIMFL